MNNNPIGFVLLVVLILLMPLMSWMSSTASDEHSQQIVIGSFNELRGENLSLESGAYFDQARESLDNNISNFELRSFDELTTSVTSEVDILFLSTANANNNDGNALSEVEQLVLYDFVVSGGCAILLPDNDSYDENADIVNESLIDEFGMDISGTLTGKVNVPVAGAVFDLVINGPYGTINSFSQNFPGGITSIGSYGISLANNALGTALVVIPRNEIQSGSGPVIIFSDVNTFIDDANLGFFSENENLFLNTISACVTSERLFLPMIIK